MGPRSQLQQGISVIEGVVSTLPGTPGTYRMLGAKGEILYVGKANNLKKRVAAYTRPERLPLLEASLIKSLRPRYNVLMRDDKSYADILITGGHDFPRLIKHRGARKDPGEYFGPFPSTTSVNETVEALQKAFMLRNCSDTFFAQRTRPCLQYHIRRCTAPCVGKATKAEYAAQVAGARAFMKGQSRAVQDELSARMAAASANQEYEKAATLRDRLKALSAMLGRQAVQLAKPMDADVFAAHAGCVSVFVFRGGRNYGNAVFFPAADRELGEADMLQAFLPQYYEGRRAPKLVLVSHSLADAALLSEALHTSVLAPQRGVRRDMVALAAEDARRDWARHVADAASQAGLLEKLRGALSCPHPVRRVEIYDNSHFMGSQPVGAMVVAGPEGFMKASYRKFNIREAAGNDDFAMMREVLSRRFREAKSDDPAFPDLLLIDGGLGQLHAVMQALHDLGIEGGRPFIAAIAKGPDRNAGRERIFIPGREEPLALPQGDALLFFIERLRDEAHRFAIGSQRKRRGKAALASQLDGLPGIGPARKRALIAHFGSGKAASRASVADLASVPGISPALAERLFAAFHPS